PNDFWPLVRKALIDQKRGQLDASLEAVQKALECTRGPTRAEIAVLGGRLALLANHANEALAFFQQALLENPQHSTAWWCAAAVRCFLGERASLAGHLPDPHLAETADPRFHYMSAVAYLSAGQFQQSLGASRKAAAAFSAAPGSIEATECGYLMGLAHLRQQDIPAASVELQQVVDSGKESPSA